MFDKMKQLMDMQKKMQEVKRQLDEATFEVSSPDGVLKITMSGSQEVKSVSIQPDMASLNKENLERSIKDTYNRAIMRSHEIAADRMKNVVGFNLPGLT